LAFKFTKKLPGGTPAEARERARSEYAAGLGRWVARGTIKPTYFDSGVFAQSLLISRLACGGAEPHPPVALDAEAKISAAMVAAQPHELRVHAPSDGTRYSSAETDVLNAMP
jgi:hypothetical protein